MNSPNPADDSRDQVYDAVNRVLADRFPHIVDSHLRSVAAEVVVTSEAALGAAALMAARDDLTKVAERLKKKAAETGDKSHLATAAGVHLACFRLIELADRKRSEAAQ